MQRLIQHLQSRGLRCRHLWLRYPFFFSLPLLAYARWRRYSWYEVTNGVRYGYWDFGQSPLMRRIFPWVYLLDAMLAAAIHVYLPLWLGATTVCERFALDMLVDVIVALKNPTFHRSPPGAWFSRLLPECSRVMILDLDAETIRKRRRDLEFDRRLEARLEAYRRLASDESIPLASSAGPMEEVAANILTVIEGKNG